MKTSRTFMKMLAVVGITAAAMSSAHAAVAMAPTPVTVAPAPVALGPVYVPTCRLVTAPVMSAWSGLTYIRTRRVCS